MIEVENLVKRYGGHLAVDHLSFTVEKGCVCGFLGPNGAGKSTTMNIMTGYLAPTEGEVRVDGHSVTQDPAGAKACIGYLPEQPPLYVDMTVREYLEFAAGLKRIPGGERAAQLDRILEMLEAKSRGGRGEHPLHDETDLDEMIDKLTGGEREGEALTVPVEEADAGLEGPAKDAAVALLRKVRPAVAAIEDRAARAKVTDALLSAIQSKDSLGEIAKAAADSAKAAAQTSKKTYDQICAESESAYAARNPHKNKKED